MVALGGGAVSYEQCSPVIPEVYTAAGTAEADLIRDLLAFAKG